MHQAFQTPKETATWAEKGELESLYTLGLGALTKAIGGGASLARTRVGTPQYWAPEVRLGGAAGPQKNLRQGNDLRGNRVGNEPGMDSLKETMDCS